MAADPDPAPGPGAPDEHGWLGRFLLAATVVAGTVSVAGALIAIVADLAPGPELFTLAMAMVMAPVLFLAHLAARSGRPALAAGIVTALMLSIGLAIALMIPGAVAQPSIVAVLGFVIARQYVHGRALRALATACWLVATAAVAIVLLRSGLAVAWIDWAFGLLPIAATLALLFGVLVVFSEQTDRAMEDERTALRATAAARDELETSRRFAEGVTEAVPGLVLVYETATGAVTYANGTATRFVGDPIIPGEPVLAGIVERGVHPAERAAVDAWRLELAAAGDDGIRTVAARLLMPDGWRWYDVRGRVFRRDAAGRTTHVLALGLDATRERGATLQRDRFFDLSGDAFVVVGQDGRIAEASPSLAPMLGVLPEALGGVDLRDIGHPDDRGVVPALMARLVRGEPRATMVVRQPDAKGSWRSIEWTLAIDPEDLLLYGAARDITERLATRDALEKVQRLETVGRLAGGVAHDVNNSLTAIGGFAALIADGSREESTRELAGEIRTAVERTATMTRKLLAFSRRQALAPRVVDLGQVVRELRPIVTQLMTEAITVELECAAAPYVLIDPAGVEQVVINLAVNARDAMPSGGSLLIRCGTRDLPDGLSVPGAGQAPGAWLEPGPYAELVVADSGTGMPAAVRQRIFEPFFSTKGDAGTGLGLAIVHGLVTGAGGSIEVESGPDSGTTFRILLPVAATQPEAPVGAAPGTAAVARRHVLLVEDEPMIRRMAQVVLERAGHRVTTAADGHEALALLDRLAGDDRPHLVVTDVVMPGMSGIDLAHRIRDRHPALPIAFASGYDQGLLPSEGPFAGARLLEKPYSPGVLVALVGELAG